MIYKWHNANSKRIKEITVSPTEIIKGKREEMIAKEREGKRLKQFLEYKMYYFKEMECFSAGYQLILDRKMFLLKNKVLLIYVILINP